MHARFRSMRSSPARGVLATATAEQLMNAGFTLGSDEPIYRRPSNHSKRKVRPEVLPLIFDQDQARVCLIRLGEDDYRAASFLDERMLTGSFPSAWIVWASISRRCSRGARGRYASRRACSR